MPDSFLDHLPSHERHRLRKMMSPEAYEKLRDRVKGPEDLEKEMKRNESLAEVRFSLESDPKLQERLKKQVENDMKEEGIENVLETSDVSPEAKKAFEQGKFRLTVSAHPSTHQDTLMAVAEGNVQEKIPVKTVFSEKYTAGLQQKKTT